MRLLPELDDVPAAVAARQVETLFGHASSIVLGAMAFAAIAAAGFAGGGSPWFLLGGAAVVATAVHRLLLSRRYRQTGGTGDVRVWARRATLALWASGACWGAWGASVPFQPVAALAVTVAVTQAACLTGAAVRCSGVRLIANGLILLTLLPELAACLLSGDRYYQMASGLIAAQIAGAMALARLLHGQRLGLLLADAEKSALLARLATANWELEEVNRHLELLAGTDALTGIANRREFDLALARGWRRMMRERQPLAVLLLDVDHFKKFNDLYGHPTGDACLRQIAATIAAAARRAGDEAARYGGEEFVAILPGTDGTEAVAIAEQIVAAVAAHSCAHAASPFGVVTVSIGVACTVPRPDVSPQSLLDAADAALYCAKAGGRNRTHVYRDTMMTDRDVAPTRHLAAGR